VQTDRRLVEHVKRARRAAVDARAGVAHSSRARSPA
jgi:hypothetical protein